MNRIYGIYIHLLTLLFCKYIISFGKNISLDNIGEYIMSAVSLKYYGFDQSTPQYYQSITICDEFLHFGSRRPAEIAYLLRVPI